MMLWESPCLPIITLSKIKGIFHCVWQCDPLTLAVIFNLPLESASPGKQKLSWSNPSSKMEKGQNAGSASLLTSSHWTPRARRFSDSWSSYSHTHSFLLGWGHTHFLLCPALSAPFTMGLYLSSAFSGLYQCRTVSFISWNPGFSSMNRQTLGMQDILLIRGQARLMMKAIKSVTSQCYT